MGITFINLQSTGTSLVIQVCWPIQTGTAPGWLPHQLCQEIIFHILQRFLDCFLSLCCISSRPLVSSSPPWKQGLAIVRLPSSLQNISSASSSQLGGLQQTPTTVSALLAFPLILTLQHSTLMSPSSRSSLLMELQPMTQAGEQACAWTSSLTSPVFRI